MSISLPTTGVPGLLDSAAAAGGFSASNPANLKHWYDASVIGSLYQDSAQTTPVASDGDPVGSFVCQVVSADDVTQDTTSAKPTYKASVVALNSKPALQFDGTDYLQGAWSAALSQPSTVFLAAQMTDVAATRAFFDGDDAANQHYAIAIGGSTWRMHAGANVAGGAANTSVHLFTFEFNTTASVLYIEGVSDGTGNAGTEAIDGLTLGAFQSGGNPATGYIAEFLIYNALLNAADKNIVQNYLAAKYGISVTEFS